MNWKTWKKKKWKEKIVEEVEEEEMAAESAREFTFERDLQNYLVQNLSLIDPALRRFETLS